ncbi:N-acetylmuramoyl-L-alanine amidase [uncultured Clostridium sp.]|uniref:N-acetylmuramoyl-L-alanine amidase n=1 Tax=uncultured Clostridium sp. TaxID=59620 RepID=UPI0025ECEF58|nr:N-acetylmuramoyl-L-alanine amidase [uncultured Clostridium sp.]
MKKNKSFLLLVCLIFMLNSFTFNVYALNSGTSSRAIGNVNIISTVDTSLERVEAWARSKNATETFVGLAKLYKKYAELRGGVNWVVAYVQAAKETGYGKFGGVLDESYHNPCGLKNPEDGDDYDAGAHKKFDNWEQGVLAHLDHLALYAAADGFPKTSYLKNWKDEPLAENETYDPRHVGWFGTTGGILGKAKDVLGLTGSWASDPNYGIELFRLYCDATNSEYLPAKSNLESPSNSEVITNGKLRIKGWALHAFGIKEIKVLVDKSQVATISTGLSRPDVNSTYPGYFNGDVSGFDQTIDISGLGTGDKTVEVIIVARNGETQSYKRNIVIKEQNVNLPKLNNLEEPSNNKIITNGKLTIKGWALDQSGVKEVRVSVDGKDFGNVNYGTTRTDVNKVYPGYPSGNNAGFEGTIDISNLTSGNKKVVVQITSNDGSIQKIERTIKVEKLESKSWLDNPNNNSISSGTLRVSGWALASSGVKEVRVYVDGKDLGTVNYGTTRTDVNNAYPGYPSGNNAGFEGSVNLSNISAGTKRVIVKITANDGTSQSIERTIKVERLESKSWLDNPNNNSISSGTLRVSGWALASSGVKEVRVYVDGKDLGTVNYGTTRTDVNNAYPGYPSGNNAGFEGTVNLGGMATGDKKLKVKITANDGTTQTIERNFVYRKAKLVVVDPGHEIESVDPGASATHNGIRYVEGNLNLQIAVKLKAQLEAMGIEVYMTRYDGLIIDKDSTESLKKRVKVANEMDADLFVSIHHNSYTSPSANGFEVYYSTGTPVSDNMIARSLITEDGRDLTLERKSYRTRNIEEKVKVSKELATVITNTASTELGLYNRGAKDSNLYVCKNTLMPSILIENGFITNPTEATKVSKDSHQQKLAEITAQKINEALK